MHFRKTAACALICFAVTIANAACAVAEVTRGQALGELMRVLDMPIQAGKISSRMSKKNLYRVAFDSAMTIGVLPSVEDPDPEIECTNAEILMFALSGMGFQHEAEIAKWALPPEDETLPGHITGYVALAKAVNPAAPESVTANPWATTTEEQLEEILYWAENCRRGIVWDCDIERNEGTLHIRRENVGRPPRGWRVQLGVFETEDAARAFMKKKIGRGVPLVITNVDYDCAFAVTTPLLTSRKAAISATKKLDTKNFSTIILPESGKSEALFWVSFTPESAGDPVVCMNGTLGLKSMEKLSKIAEASDALVAMNGGYFKSGAPIGGLHVGGFPVSLPYYNRSMVAWDDEGNAFFGGGEFRLHLAINDGESREVQLNCPPNLGETSVITPPVGRPSAHAGNNGTVARVKGDEIVEVLGALQYRGELEDDEWLIVSRDQEFALKVGDKAEIQTQFRDEVPFEPTCAVQAGPLLYAPGHKFWKEKFNSSILKMRHPRTLIGWTGEKIVWIVADGRSSWHSRGLNLDEAAALGKRLGLIALLNLDGGGSSEMWWDGHVVNSVSDGHERSVPYGLAVMHKEAPEEEPEPQKLTRKEKKHVKRVARKVKKHNARIIRKVKKQAQKTAAEDSDE